MRYYSTVLFNTVIFGQGFTEPLIKSPEFYKVASCAGGGAEAAGFPGLLYEVHAALLVTRDPYLSLKGIGNTVVF